MRTLEEIKGRCFVTDDDHWLWRGAVRPDGRPNIYAPDPSRHPDGRMTTQSGARAVWHVANQKAVPEGYRVYGVCEHPDCCNPKCIRCTDERQYGLFVVRIRRRKNEPNRIAANRAIAMKRAALTSAQVLYVQSSCKKGSELAGELGVSTTTISKYRRGENTVTASGGAPNPFAALMR